MTISGSTGAVTSHGYNLSSDNGGGFLNGPGDQINTNPLLGPLQDNGGPNFTHNLLTGSPALDTGDPNFTPPPSTDQRGYARVYNGRIDIGSLEVQRHQYPLQLVRLHRHATATATATATAIATATPTATSTATATPSGACTPVIVFNEDFDGVTAPALPPGWVASFTSGPANCTPTGTCALGTNWATSTTTPDTPPNCDFHNDPGCVTDSALDTPSFVSGTFSTVLSFRHSYNLESGSDGAVLEISINGGAFTDIITAGGQFLLPGAYNGTISSGLFSPIAGRSAWTVIPGATLAHPSKCLRPRRSRTCACAFAWPRIVAGPGRAGALTRLELPTRRDARAQPRQLHRLLQLHRLPPRSTSLVPFLTAPIPSLALCQM